MGRIREFFSSWAARIGAAIVCLIVLMAITAPVISPCDPLEMDESARLVKPNAEHIMGTDEYGRDIFSRIVYGARTSIMIGVCSVLMAAVIGVNIGLIAGYTSRIFDAISMRLMDAVIAFPSSGVHSNGFSLVRRVFGIDSNPDMLGRRIDDLGMTIGEALLAPTRIYVKDAMAAIAASSVHAICHITGGGFYENIPRVLPEGFGVSIRKSDIRIHPIFPVIQKEGNIPERDMFNTFNMGVGMALIVSSDTADSALKAVPGSYILGEIVKSDDEVRIW